MAGDPPGESVTGPLPDGPPRALIIVAVAIAVIVLGAILAIAASHRIPIAPVAIAAVSAPGAQTRECQTLLNALPDALGGLPRAATAEPTPAGTAAWRGDGEPVILRCGLGRPAEFVVGAPIQVVNDVEWFQIDDAAIGRSSWVSVDRPVYVALTLPTGYGAAPIQDMSELIARTMSAVPIRPGPPS